MGRGSAGASPSGAAKGQRARPGRSSSPTLWGRSLKTPRRLGVSGRRCWCSKAGITRRGPRSARRHPRRGPTTKRARAARRGRLVHSQVRADGKSHACAPGTEKGHSGAVRSRRNEETPIPTTLCGAHRTHKCTRKGPKTEDGTRDDATCTQVGNRDHGRVERGRGGSPGAWGAAATGSWRSGAMCRAGRGMTTPSGPRGVCPHHTRGDHRLRVAAGGLALCEARFTGRTQRKSW